MKISNRAMGFFLAVAVLFSSLPAAVFAEEVGAGADVKDSNAVIADKDWLTFDIIGGANQDAEHIEYGLCLPVTGENGSMITWASSDSSVIDADKNNLGDVTRPSAAEGDRKVTLTATLSSGSATDQKVFDLTVIALESTDIPPDKLHTRLDYYWLTYSVILNQNENNSNPPDVTTDLSLPKQGKNGSDISWTTSDESVIAIDGTVTRPPVSKSDDGYSYSVTVIAEITNGDYKLEKSFPVRVACLSATEDEEKVNMACRKLTADQICGFNTQDCVLSNLTLPTGGLYDCEIAWASSDPSIIAADGTVTLPAYNLTGYRGVTLTATVSKNNAKQTKQFTVRVLCAPSGDTETAVQNDAKWLTGEDEMKTILNGNANADAIQTDLILSTKAANGSTVSWSSSDPSTVAEDGKVTRPVWDGQSVTLTATVTNGEAQAKRKIVLLVPCRNKTEDEQNVDDDYNGLVEDSITYGNVDTSLSHLTTDLRLPRNDGTGGNPYFCSNKGCTVSWKSSDESVLSLTEKQDCIYCTTTPPSFLQGDKKVTLTATITKGDASRTKTFQVTVPAQNPAGAEAVVLDKEWLTESLILNGNSADDVKRTLNLPGTGKYGSSISWQSSGTAVDPGTGIVTRPEQNGNDISITLTANLSISSNGREAQDTKTFRVTVTRKENSCLAIVPGAGSDNFQVNGTDGAAQCATADGKTVFTFKDNAPYPNYISGGSIFTKQKIHLEDDGSFSTSFSFQTAFPSGADYGEGGFTFTLQAAGTDKFGTGKASLGVSGVSPSVSVGFASLFPLGQQGGQSYNWHGIKAFVNGDYDSRPFGTSYEDTGYCLSDTPYTVWIDYNGTAKTMEVRMAKEGSPRPEKASFAVIQNADLNSVFQTEDGKKIQDLYAGFTGGAGKAGDSFQIWNWSLQNGSNPIDPRVYDYIDASRVGLPADRKVDQQSFQVEATVLKADGTAASGVPVTFSSTYGDLSTSSAVSDKYGKAAVTLNVRNAGLAQVEAVAAGGACASATYSFAFSDEDSVNLDIAWLRTAEEQAAVLNGNSGSDNILTDLTLPEKGLNGSAITWTSDNAAITAAGKVTPPPAGQKDRTVILTAAVSKGNVSKSQTFSFTVKTTDAVYVLADYTALTDAVLLNGDGDADLQHVTKDLKLPGQGANGSIITWISSAFSVINEAGKVTRASFVNGEKTATLTATLKRGTATMTKEFKVTVLALAPTDQESVAADAGALTEAVILSENTSGDSVKTNLGLPAAGKNGSTIAWASSNSLYLTANGTVTRPAYSTGDQSVTLTATLTKGQASVQKKFVLTIKKLDATDEEVLLEGSRWLNESRTLGPDNLSQYAVTSELTLPNETASGLSITWKSNRPDYIADNGTVTRPEVGYGDRSVTLTATISNSTGSLQKKLQYTVLAIPDTTAPYVSDSSLKENQKAAYDTRKIILTFSEAIQIKDQSGITLKGPDAPEFYAMVNAGDSGVENQLVITLSGELDSDSRYTLTISKNAVTDLSGNLMAYDYNNIFIVEKKTVRTIHITSTNPADGTKDYTGTGSFKVTFDSTYDLDGTLSEGPAFNGIRIVEQGGKEYTASSADFKVIGNALSLTLPNSAVMQPGYSYQIIVPKGAVQDYYKNTNEAKTVQFSTHYSGTVHVFGVYPSYGMKSVDIHQEIFFTVPGGSTLSTSGVTLKYGSGNTVEASVNQFGSNPFDYVVQPIQPLKPSTVYTMVIAKDALALKASNGTSYMASDYTLKFTTGGNSLPIQSTSPAALNQQADVGGTVTINFASNVRKVETKGGIVIGDASGLVKSSASEDGSVVTVDTDFPLNDVKTYTVTLPAGAYESGGKENDALQFRFITAKAIDEDACTFDVNPSITQVEAEPTSFGINAIKSKMKLFGLTPKTCEWSFGDGSTSQEESPSHTFAAAGMYSVTLAVTDSKGHAYQWERTVNVITHSSGQIHLSVSPSTNTACFLTDTTNLHDYQEFDVHLALGRDSVPLCGKTIRAQLYKDGSLVENLFPNSAVTGNGSHVYKTVNGNYQKDYGYAVFPLWYHSFPAGTYELRFIYGTEEDNVTASVPITIYNKRTSQDLKLKLIDTKTGDTVNGLVGMYFLLDGKKVKAQMCWLNDKDRYGLFIPDVPLGRHTLEYVSESEGEEKFTYTLSKSQFYHSGENNIVSLTAVPHMPGIVSVTSEVSDSNKKKDTVFIDGIWTPTFTFTVKGNWNNIEGSRYIMKTSTGRILEEEYGTDKATFEWIPAYTLRPGERLLFGMRTSDGRQSAWVDAKVKIIAQPDLGHNSDIIYEDGQYTVLKTVTVPAINASASDDPDLDEDTVPGLGGTSGLLENAYKTLGGKWDPNRITMDKIRLTYDVNTGYTQNDTVKELESAVMMKALGYSVNVDFSGEYLLNYNSSTNQWEVYYQTFSITGQIDKKVFKRSIKIPKTSISAATLSVKLGVLVRNTLVYDFSKSSLPSGQILHIEPRAEGDVEVGWDAANITASLEARLPLELHYPTEYFEINPNATFKVKARFLLYSKTLYKKRVETEWNNGKKKVNLLALARAGGLTASKNLEETPRDYLTRTFRWLSSVPAPKLFALKAAAKPENPSVETLAQNVYPDAGVQLVESGGKLYAIWTDDNSERSDENRTQLRYAVYDNGTWSEPEWLGADATGDFSPAAAAAGDGTLIAWQDMKTETSADADDASRNCEISVSEDPLTDSSSGFKAVRLTDDDRFDHSPKIASDGDGAIVTWVKSDALALDGTASHDSLWAAKWTKNGGWSGAEKLDDVGHTVVNSALAMHGAKAVLLYTVDMDDNLSTSDDQEIYSMTWDGSSWGKPVRLTDNDVEDSSPQVTYSNGGLLMVWNQDSQIVYRAGLDGENKTADCVSGAGNKFQLVSTGGDHPQVTLVYYLPGDNGTKGLAESTYDAAAGLWGNEKVLTDGTGGYTGAFSPVYTDAGQLKIFYTQADMVTESIDGADYNSASDKADLNLLTFTPAHDLALDSDDGLRLSAGTPVAGVPETVTATVDNLGDYAENATVSLYRGNPANGGVMVAQSKVTAVAAHSSAQVEIVWPVESGFSGACGLYAVVSPAEGITDSDESNNSVSRIISASDLSIGDADGEYLSGNKYRVTAAVGNVGSDTLKNVVLNLIDDKSGKIIATETINELEPGVTGGFDQIVSADGLTADSDGNYNVSLKAVLPEGVTDNDTENNSESFKLEAPFLMVDCISPAPNEKQVELQNPVTVTFGTNIKKGSEFSGVSLKDASLNPVEITAELKDNTMTVTPKGNMAKGTQYTLTIPTDAVSDSYSHKMEKPYILTFSTVTSSPEVVFADPGEEMKNASADSDIRLKYNQKIGTGSNFSGIKVTDGSSRSVSVSAKIDGQWLTLNPSENLSGAAQYTVTIPTGSVKNESGEVQQQAYSYRFMTESAEEKSLSDLQSLVSTCGAMTQGSYTDESWAVFQTALKGAQAVLEESNPSEAEIQAAIQALTAAKNDLSEKSGGHSSTDSTDGTALSDQNADFRSDTTEAYHFGRNAVYYYKITTSDPTDPIAVSSNPLVATVRLMTKLSDGYLFQITDVGEGTAVITTISAGGARTSFAVHGTVPQGIVSDTPFYHNIKTGSTYQFKFTAPTDSAVPIFTSGNGRIVQPILLRKEGNTYYFKVRMQASGKVGIYQALPGSPAVLRCVLSSSG